jgi:hypothetical protein
MRTTTEMIDKWIKKYGNAVDALNVAIAKLEYLQIWFILYEKKCPECLSDIATVNQNRFLVRCMACGSTWHLHAEMENESEENHEPESK